MKTAKVLAIIGAFLATVPIANATTFNSDGSPTNIQSIHDNQAQNGDTITVPSGTFTWTSKITITKAITLQGQGVGTTIIKDDVQSGSTFVFTLAAGQLTRVTGIEFQDGGRVNAQPSPTGVFHVNGSNTDGSKFRMDNSKMVELNGCVVFDTVLGVIDHSSFVNGNTSGNICVYGSNWNGQGPYGDGSWVAQTNFGSADFLFFEDCDFHNENATYESVSAEAYGGGRWVARHCTLYNTGFGDHGTESTGRPRGGRAAEIYNNTWTGTNKFSSLCGSRSSRVIFHDNSVSGMYNGGSISLQCFRTFYPFNPWGGADATNVWDVNEPTVFFSGTAAGNSSGTTVTVSGNPNWTTNYWAGYTIRRTSNLGGLNTVTYAWINSSTSNTITYTTNGGYTGLGTLAFTTGDTLEFRKLDHELDQPGRGQGSLITGANPTPPSGWNDQVTEPCYCWNNGSVVFWAGPGVRDGIHCFSNTPMPGYTPYIYPHPLVATPPGAPPAVRDGTGADITYTTSNTQLSANWDAATDPDGSVTAYQYAIGTSAGGTQTVNWTTLGNVTTVTKTGLSLTNGQTYYFSVKAVDNQGLVGNATNSNGQTVDTTAPGAPANVRDGTGTDISTTSSTTQLSANWDASTDAQSGISGYQYAIGTSAGGTQTVNWTSLGNVTTVTKTGLSLTIGQTYYFSVKAINGAGLTGAATNSNGQTVVDTTPPSAPPAVRDGTGTDISTTVSTTQLSANWDASTDNESGISGYQYAIGTSAGGTQTVNWTSLGNVTTVTKTGLTLTVGQTYYFSVKAINGAGLTGSATNSNGQTVVSSATTYFSDNFENWTVHGGAWSSVSGETATQTQNTSTDYARAGTKSLKLTDNDTTNTYGACLVKSFSPTIASGIYVRFYVYLPSAYVSANNGAASRRLLRVFCGSNRGQMSLYLGARPLMEEVGAWGSSTDPSSLSADAWHCIEMYMATPSASTAMQYWVDGTSTGTLNGSFSGSTAYNRIEFGDVSVGSGTNALGTFYLDEVIVSDTYNGPLP